MKTINILVADHSEATRKEFADFFEKRKDMHLMDSVDNGQDACNAILNRKPDIVLLDVVLPVMDGFSVIEKVNGDDSLLHAPAFIVVSSIGNQSMIECACKLGVAYYILKPFSLDNLARRILQIAAAREETLRQKKVEEETSGKKETRALSAAGYTESSLEADITLPNFCILPSQRNIRRLQAVWSGQSAMPSRWPGTGEGSTCWRNCLGTR